jgi:hypothetical protein
VEPSSHISELIIKKWKTDLNRNSEAVGQCEI